MGQLNQGNQVGVQLYRSFQEWPRIKKNITCVVIKTKGKKLPPDYKWMQCIYHFHHWQTQREQERTAWASWLKAGRTPRHYRPYFWRIKKKSVNPQWSNVFPLLRPLVRCGESTDGPPTARGTVGDKTAMLNSPSDISLPVYSADISPPPLSEILFLHRFEQEEVGRWSRQKRQACGPLATSCSLFCDTKSV